MIVTLMIHKRLLHFFQLLAFSLIVSACTDPDAGQEDHVQPNIIFILVDDMGWGDLGAYWQNRRMEENDRTEPWHFTPSLDAMAAGGAMLTNHYCSAPVCAPSRASLLLGLSQGHANVRNNQFDKALEDSHTLASVLKQGGYHTAAIGKWGLQGRAEAPDWPAHPLKRGFDYYFGYMRHRDGHEHYPKEGLYRGEKEVWENYTDLSGDLDKCFTTDLWTAVAKKYIAERVHEGEGSTPFFLYLAYDVPHAVLELPTQEYPGGGGLKGGLQWTGKPGEMINTASGEIDSYVHPDYRDQTYDHDHDPGTPEVNWPGTYKRYATSCRRIDQGIGDLLVLLKDLGIEKNTLVVFTSDNGPSREAYLPEPYVSNEPTFFNSFGPFDGIKRDLWEGGVRVPVIAYWPGVIPASMQNDAPCAMYDWLPTFAGLAGLPAPARTDGISLLPMLTGNKGSLARPVYIEYENNQPTPSYDEFFPAHRGRTRNQMQKIRIGDFAGVRYNIVSADDDFEIYNVVSDPQETRNLGGDAAYSDMQSLMKHTVLQMRRPDSTAARPYDNALVPGIQTGILQKGVRWNFYEGAFPWIPDPASLEATAGGNAPGLDVSLMDQKPGMVVFSGMLEIPANGSYRFMLRGSGPVLMRVHQALLIDGEGKSQNTREHVADIRLEAGFHPFRLYLLNKNGDRPTLDLSWSGPGISAGSIPDEHFYFESY